MAEADPSQLLDRHQLGELAALGLLDASFASGIEQLRALIAQLREHAAKGDLDAAHGALHLLLGASGNIGAKALHQFTRHIYPRTLEGAWPAEPDWLERIGELGERSAEALHRYLELASAGQGRRGPLEPPEPLEPTKQTPQTGNADSASPSGLAMREH